MRRGISAARTAAKLRSPHQVWLSEASAAAAARLAKALGFGGAEVESEHAPSSVDETRFRALRAALTSVLDARATPALLATTHVLNLFAAALVYAGMPPALRTGLRSLHIACTALFGAEAAARCVVLGPGEYCATWARLAEGAISIAAVVRARARQHALGACAAQSAR